ncbi:MAG: cobalamin B12-binding domain-containing protein, partial [Desulfobacterota bacterium]|nr:cobalamin B12-binding domain-containing protein [Thermodesulfobacteriota bacterium]
MKVLLIQPPIQDFYQTPTRIQPIGLAYLAASLKANGYEVEILDAQKKKRKTIPFPPELFYLREFYPDYDRSPFKLYTHYYHFGLDWEEIKERIKNSRAEVFGISSLFTPYQAEALKIARIIKEWDKGKIVVFGGANASTRPIEILQNPEVDYVIIGEGEK